MDDPPRDPHAELVRRLGPSAEGLSPGQAESLYAVLRRAHTEHRQAMSDAVDESLGYIPALLRPGVRKIMGM